MKEKTMEEKVKAKKPPWNKGIQFSDEWRQHLREAHVGMQGRKHSDESREKMRVARTKYWERKHA